MNDLALELGNGTEPGEDRAAASAGAVHILREDLAAGAALLEGFDERPESYENGCAPRACVLINDDQALARAVGAHGLHLSSQRPWQLGLDFVVLGPLLPTASHPGAAGIGWAEFSRLVERSPLPVYALGGMQPGMLETACSEGAHGLALMRGWR